MEPWLVLPYIICSVFNYGSVSSWLLLSSRIQRFASSPVGCFKSDVKLELYATCFVAFLVEMLFSRFSSERVIGPCSTGHEV